MLFHSLGYIAVKFVESHLRIKAFLKKHMLSHT